MTWSVEQDGASYFVHGSARNDLLIKITDAATTRHMM
jgi:hypothetical protein